MKCKQKALSLRSLYSWGWLVSTARPMGK